jgi:hypothetical protein
MKTGEIARTSERTAINIKSYKAPQTWRRPLQSDAFDIRTFVR